MSVLDIDRDYNMLSLHDLIAARDQYHLHLMGKQHVVGTAVGRYLIPTDEKWPRDRRDLLTHDTKQRENAIARQPRELGTSEVRPYSFPCVLVFVDSLVDPASIERGDVDRTDLVPHTLYMPDGTRVPICVVYAPVKDEPAEMPIPKNYPEHWIGGGFPLLIDSQGEEYVASIGCVVTDGHTYYALTNRHVAGPVGTPVYAIVGGARMKIGTSAGIDIRQRPFEQVYPHWPGKRVLLNLDVGLVEIGDITDWTTMVYGIGAMGPLADVSTDNLSLRIIDCDVVAHGAVSGQLEGKIKALFYRYKTVGGFEYVADCLIAPCNREGAPHTQPGDSGTVWMLKEQGVDARGMKRLPRPIAIEWGAQRFVADGTRTTPFTLATFLSTACRELQVDVVRDWNVAPLTYWGAVGHFLIGQKAIDFLPDGALKTFLLANRANIGGPLSDRDGVPLADVPDLVWKAKVGTANGQRGAEGPNHFANMDTPDPHQHGKTLLQICEDPTNIRVDVWERYYNDVGAKEMKHGLLPFRVWQLFDNMVKALASHTPDYVEFLCTAGVLAHYVGDACQPMHISREFDTDPAGAHHAYEATMVSTNRPAIARGVDGLAHDVHGGIHSGSDAARATVALMQKTFDNLDPAKIISAYLAAKHDRLDPAQQLWQLFDQPTIKTFGAGCETLARIWLSAWELAGGDARLSSAPGTLAPGDLRDRYVNQDFVPSTTLKKIGNFIGAGEGV